MSDGYFWFEAQVGIIHYEPPKAPSNFYRYRLPLSVLGKVKIAVEKASFGSCGLEYEPGFLDWLWKTKVPGGQE